MSRLLKILTALAAGIVLALAALLFVLYRWIEVGELRRFLIAELEQRTRMKVAVGAVELNWGWVTGVSLSDVALWEPGAAAPAVRARGVVTRFALAPLLERKIVFEELRLVSPEVEVVRDAAGRIPLWDALQRLLAPGPDDLPLQLALQALHAEGGTLRFIDRLGREQRTELRGARLSIARPQRPLSLVVASAEPALEFSLSGRFQRNDWTAPVAARGRITFPGGKWELEQARWDADIRLDDAPAGLLRGVAEGIVPVSAASGSLAARLRIHLAPGGKGFAMGGVQFRDLRISAPSLFAAEIAPGRGRLEARVDWTPTEARASLLEWDSEEIRASGRATLRRSPGKAAQLEIHVTTPFLPVTAVRKYLPPGLTAKPFWGRVLDGVKTGEVRVSRAGFALPPSGLGELFAPGKENAVWFDAEVRGVTAAVPGSALPLRNLSGRVRLERGVLHYEGLRASYGRSVLEEVSGTQRGLFGPSNRLELEARGRLELEEVREQLPLDLFPARVRDAVAELKELQGGARLSLKIVTDLASAYQYEGLLALEGARMAVSGLALSQLSGNLRIAPDEVRGEGISAAFAGAPVSLDLRVSDPVSERARFDLAVRSAGVPAGAAMRLLLGKGSPQDPGIVRGTVRYRGALGANGERSLAGVLELQETEPPLAIFAAPLRRVSGIVRFDDRTVELRALRARLGSYPVEFSGRLSMGSEPELKFSLAAPELDVAALAPRDGAGEADGYDKLRARGEVQIGKGRYERFEFANLRTDVRLERRRWTLENFRASAGGGTLQGGAELADDGSGEISLEGRVEGVPVDAFLRWFGWETADLTGRVHLNGALRTRGGAAAERRRNLGGAFRLRIEDGTARRLRVLVGILGLLDLSNWFTFRIPDFTREGIRFRSVTGDFKVSQGLYTTQNLFVDSDDLRITGAGALDGSSGEADFLVAVRPFPRLDTAARFLPLIGPGLAAIKNSLLVASFHVKGPIDNPAISPAPLGTLSEFFFSALAIPRSILGAGEGKP